jgi:hypothetical protein
LTVEQRIDLGKDRDRQLMLFQQMAEAKEGTFVRHDVFEGILSGELPQQGNIVQRFFHGRIGVAKPWLQEVNPPRRGECHRRASVSLLRVNRFDQRFQAQPRHNRFHLRQKYCLPGLLPCLRHKTRLGQAQLLHPFHPLNTPYDSGAIVSKSQG